jgi:hypothetical protein
MIKILMFGFRITSTHTFHGEEEYIEILDHENIIAKIPYNRFTMAKLYNIIKKDDSL